MIKIENLTKIYPNVTPLKDVCAEINKGDIISVIGPSGTGKSTLLRCINRLEEPTSGKIIVDGEDITNPKCNINKVRRKMGMVFQSFNLFANLNIIENIMSAPVNLLKKSKDEAYDEGMALLRRVGLEDKAMNFPDELSGGQKQRVAI
ncbi:MAG: amino acid ABC transporter ATP-binding protein, partial [Ruminococcus sp.]|nr:amino acid ABC transporter ATP-binding protein [Ruminococcus sp.]